MPKEVRASKDETFVIARLFDRVSRDDLDKSVEEIERICGERLTRRVLIDVSGCDVAPHAVDIVRLVSRLRGISPCPSRTAVVVAPDHSQDWDFIETAADNRGLILSCWKSLEDAQKWLEKPPHSP